MAIKQPTVTITQTGIMAPEFLFKLNNVIDENCREGEERLAQETAERAKWYAPVKTGELRDSIGSIGARIFARAGHAGYIEYGTSRFNIPPNRRYPGDKYPGQAYMRPALDELRGGKGTSTFSGLIKNDMRGHGLYGMFHFYGLPGIGKAALAPAISNQGLAQFRNWNQFMPSGTRDLYYFIKMG